MATTFCFAAVARYCPTFCKASRTSDSSTILYLSKTARVLCPLSCIATISGTPAFRRFVTALLLLSVYTLADSKTERHWHPAMVREIHRIQNRENGYHWEYVIVSDGLIYRVLNAGKDLPYLNDSLGGQVKIASAGDSDKPYDSNDVLVLDVNAAERRMGLISVVVADDGCKK